MSYTQHDKELSNHDEQAESGRGASDRRLQAVDAGSIEWVEPLPEGFEWIEAYLSWTRYP